MAECGEAEGKPLGRSQYTHIGSEFVNIDPFLLPHPPSENDKPKTAVKSFHDPINPVTSDWYFYRFHVLVITSGKLVGKTKLMQFKPKFENLDEKPVIVDFCNMKPEAGVLEAKMSRFVNFRIEKITSGEKETGETSIIVKLSFIDVDELPKIQHKMYEGKDKVHMLVYLIDIFDEASLDGLFAVIDKLETKGSVPKILVGNKRDLLMDQDNVTAAKRISARLDCSEFGTCSLENGYGVTHNLWRPILEVRKKHFLKYFQNLDLERLSATKTMTVLIAGKDAKSVDKKGLMDLTPAFTDDNRVSMDGESLERKDNSRTWVLGLPSQDEKYKRSRRYDIMKFRFLLITTEQIEEYCKNEEIWAILLMYARSDWESFKMILKPSRVYPKDIDKFLVDQKTLKITSGRIVDVVERDKMATRLECASHTDIIFEDPSDKIALYYTKLKIYNDIIVPVWKKWIKAKEHLIPKPQYFAQKPDELEPPSGLQQGMSEEVASTSGLQQGTSEEVASTSGLQQGTSEQVASTSGLQQGTSEEVASTSGLQQGTSEEVASTSGLQQGTSEEVASTSGLQQSKPEETAL